MNRVHREYPSIVRVMLTGEASLGAVVDVIKDGLYRLLSKPVNPGELVRTLSGAIQMKRLGELLSAAPASRLSEIFEAFSRPNVANLGSRKLAFLIKE